MRGAVLTFSQFPQLLATFIRLTLAGAPSMQHIIINVRTQLLHEHDAHMYVIDDYKLKNPNISM